MNISTPPESIDRLLLTVRENDKRPNLPKRLKARPLLTLTFVKSEVKHGKTTVRMKRINTAGLKETTSISLLYNLVCRTSIHRLLAEHQLGNPPLLELRSIPPSSQHRSRNQKMQSRSIPNHKLPKTLRIFPLKL
jgi:hypothetical protein